MKYNLYKRVAKRQLNRGGMLLGAALLAVGLIAGPVAGTYAASSGTTSASNVKTHPGNGTAKKQAATYYAVTSVTDGDTIKVDIKGVIQTVRFIGIDTPETKDPRKPVQCFGIEATARMKQYVEGKSVALITDSTQGDHDKYGRLLRYVFLQDGTHVGYEMIRGGYAHEYTYALPYAYQTEFKEAQRLAMESEAGLWSPDTCNGITNQEYPE